MSDSFHDFARVIGGASSPSLVEDFEDDDAQFPAEGWRFYTSNPGGSGDVTTTSPSLAGSRWYRQKEAGGGRSALRNEADTANAEMTLYIDSTDVAGGATRCGFDYYDSTGGVMQVGIDADANEVLYKNDQAGVSQQAVASGTYDTGTQITLEVRNAESGIEVLVDGSVEFSTTDTFTNVKYLEVVSEDVQAVFDDIRFNPSQQNPLTDSEWPTIPGSDYNSWFAIHSPEFGTTNSILPNWHSAGGTNNMNILGPTFVSSAKWSFGQALQFDGTDDVTEYVSSNFGIYPSDEFTAVMTVQPDSLTSAMSVFNGSHWKNGTTHMTFQTNRQTDGNVVFNSYSDSGDSLRVETGTVLSTSSPTRVAFVKTTGTAASTLDIYIDGNSVSTTIVNDNLSDNFRTYNNSGFGAYRSIADGSEGGYYSGILDDFGLITRALTSSEVQADYDRQNWS